jgi:hypothetical protein
LRKAWRHPASRKQERPGLRALLLLLLDQERQVQQQKAGHLASRLLLRLLLPLPSMLLLLLLRGSRVRPSATGPMQEQQQGPCLLPSLHRQQQQQRSQAQ